MVPAPGRIIDARRQLRLLFATTLPGP